MKTGEIVVVIVFIILLIGTFVTLFLMLGNNKTQNHQQSQTRQAADWWNPKWTKGTKWFLGTILAFSLGWFLITRVSCGSRSVSRHESPVHTHLVFPSGAREVSVDIFGGWESIVIDSIPTGGVVKIKNPYRLAGESTWNPAYKASEEKCLIDKGWVPGGGTYIYEASCAMTYLKLIR
jgi:hypothetical protein